MSSRFLGLCLPPIAFAFFDAAITLAGQSKAYWSGSYHFVNEGGPSWYYLLSIHPLAFVGGILFWAALFSAIILLLPDTLALIASLNVTLTHAACAATWIQWRYPYWYDACSTLYLLAAVAIGIGIRWGWQAAPAQEASPSRLSPKWRWGLVTGLFAILVVFFLLPRVL